MIIPTWYPSTRNEGWGNGGTWPWPIAPRPSVPRWRVYMVGSAFPIIVQSTPMGTAHPSHFSLNVFPTLRSQPELIVGNPKPQCALVTVVDWHVHYACPWATTIAEMVWMVKDSKGNLELNFNVRQLFGY